jgi:glycosyltransferase involved in cell wall biosynthesis
VHSFRLYSLKYHHSVLSQSEKHPDRPLSICMLVTDFDSATGGVQRNSRLLLREFNRRGCRTYVCARNYQRRPRHEALEGTEIYRSAVFGSSRALNGVLYFFQTILWLATNQHKYDVIHCQQMFGPAMAAAAASFLVRKPIVVRITLSGPTGEATAVKTLPFASFRLALLKRVSSWVALTGEMKRELEEIGISGDRITVINNATELPTLISADDQTRSDMRSKLELPYEIVALFAGRLSEEKNVDILLQAWADVVLSHPGAHLLLLGDGGEYRNAEEGLKKTVSDLSLSSNVHFLGHRVNVKDFLIASDIFVLPTSAEGMSNSLVEAFACGTAIVATDIPANREICVDGENSLLVPVRDSDALATALIRLSADPNLARTLGRNARELAESSLSLDRMVDGYLGLYRRLLSQ